MSDYQPIIGIDPGTTTGYAMAEGADQELTVVESGTFYEAVEFVRGIDQREDGDFVLIVEDARKRKWYGNTGREVLQGVGMVKRDCNLWEEYSEHEAWEIYFIHPKKITTKMDADYFENVTGWEGRTNEHKRDAGMIAFQFYPDILVE